MARRWIALQRILRLGLVCACLALLSSQALAARVTVVLSDDSAPYQEVYQAIQTALLGYTHETRQLYAEGVSASALSETRLIVAVGVRAAESLAALQPRQPVLAVLVPREWYLNTGRSRLGDNGRHAFSAIYLDQPANRQARLIRLVFPEIRRVGVLLGEEQQGLIGELDEAFRAQGISLTHQTLTAGERLVGPLEEVLTKADVLLAMPDPLVFNRNTAQSIFLTTYRYRIPVLGYSRSLTRAGALFSLHSSPAQIGRQAAEWIGKALQGSQVRLPSPAYPAYFSVSINEQVARSLGFKVPLETELEKQLGVGR